MAPVTAASSSSAFNRIGFWSPNTASVDWCENNYVVSYYIAEPSMDAKAHGFRSFSRLGFVMAKLANERTLTTYIFSTTGGKLQFYTFQSTYTTLQLCMIYYLRLLHVQQRSKRPNPAVSVLIRRALLFGAFAVSIWLIDLRLCEFINGVGPKSVLRWNPQLHAWWHVFSAVAMYHAALLVGYYHYDVIGQRPIVYQWRGFLPALKLDVLSENHKTM
ncbi:Alkaline ceramidase 3 [Gamsiella multidivaricata]|nr:Alkaline ceramidase 3 [Gamsiella multidivaricata]